MDVIKQARGFVSTPHGQVHYRTAGAGEPLLLLHQTSRSSDEFAEMLPILGRSRRVIAMDTLGYGDSDLLTITPSKSMPLPFQCSWTSLE